MNVHSSESFRSTIHEEKLKRGIIVEHKISANHTPNGMILIIGDTYSCDKSISATVYDIVPTILAYLDLPLPHDTDGRILHEVTELKEFKTINYLNRWKMLLKARKIAQK